METFRVGVERQGVGENRTVVLRSCTSGGIFPNRNDAVLGHAGIRTIPLSTSLKIACDRAAETEPSLAQLAQCLLVCPLRTASIQRDGPCALQSPPSVGQRSEGRSALGVM